jgi:hypothetical protein
MSNVVPLRVVTEAVADPDAQGVIEALERMLEMARNGEVRSIMLAGIAHDGCGFPNAWYIADGDAPHAVSMLTKLTHRIIR